MRETSQLAPIAALCQTCGQPSPRPLVEVVPGHNICRRCRNNFNRGWGN